MISISYLSTVNTLTSSWKYMKWSSDNSIECLPHFWKMALSQFKVYIEAEKCLNVLCATTVIGVFSFHVLMLKKGFLYLTDFKDPYWSAQVYQEG